MICPLYAVGQEDILLRILLILGIFPEDHSLELPVELAAKVVLLLPRKHDIDHRYLRHKGEKELSENASEFSNVYSFRCRMPFMIEETVSFSIASESA